MVVPAIARVGLDSSRSSSYHELVRNVVRAVPDALDEGDEAVLSLAVALLEQADAARVDTARALTSSANRLPAGRWHGWLRAAQLLLDRLPRALLEPYGWAPPPAGRAVAERELAELLLSVRSNAHRVLDDESCSRVVGLGLYPAACMLNHDCAPCANIYYREGGSELHVRAIADVRAGCEVFVSYLSEEQLCAPWAERRKLLSEAHHFEPTEPAERREAEAESAADEELARRTRQLISAAASATGGVATSVGVAGAAEAPADPGSLRSSLDALRSLLHAELEPRLRTSHYLVHEACAAVLALGRALDEPGIVARYALQLAHAREAVLPRGTVGLAALYAAHAGALSRLLRERRVPEPQRAEAARQAAAALQAAARIRGVCLGADHPLTQATAATLSAAEERAVRFARGSVQSVGP